MQVSVLSAKMSGRAHLGKRKVWQAIVRINGAYNVSIYENAHIGEAIV